MRAKNREINIFNMSLLDILTGMLGAFLFMMIGMVPYYAKVMQSKVLTAEEAKKFEELKKLLDAGLQGPLTPEQAQALRDQLAALEGRISSLESQLKEAQQQLADAKEEINFWQNQDAKLLLTAEWDNAATDIDVFMRGPKGSLFGVKKETLFGRQVVVDGTDSHTAEYRSSYEGLLAFLAIDGGGEYLVFYRVPKDAAPGTYADLRGFFMYVETASKRSHSTSQNSLGVSKSALAKLGGFYAWKILVYDAEKHTITNKAPANPLPDGILMPQ